MDQSGPFLLVFLCTGVTCEADMGGDSGVQTSRLTRHGPSTKWPSPFNYGPTQHVISFGPCRASPQTQPTTRHKLR